MTWKEIKDKIESEGIKDDDVIDYIDVSSDIYQAKDIECVETHGRWEIFN